MEDAMKGNGETTLKDVVEAIAKLGDRMDRGFASVNERIDSVNVRIDGTNRRIDKLIENTGSHYRALERRLTTLEKDVARLKKAG
jgi:flagellar capping protein FliD